MKYTQLNAFEKHLNAASPHHFADVYVILSKESFERRLGEELLLKFMHSAFSGLSPVILEGEDVGAQALRTELNTLSFFTPRHLVVIQHVEKLKAAAKEVLDDYLTKPSRKLFLVLSAESLAVNTVLYKKAEKAGVVLELGIGEKSWEKESRMAEWLVSSAASADKKLDSRAAQAMLQQLGVDQALLNQELQKLICYVGERSLITTEDVVTICINVNVETIWQLGEAIFKSEAGSAFRIAKSLLRQGGALIPLLRQLRTQFQTGLLVSSVLSKGGAPEEISKSLPYLKGSLLQRQIDFSKRYGMARYKKGLIQIDATETLSKNSAVDHELLLDKLLITLTSTV